MPGIELGVGRTTALVVVGAVGFSNLSAPLVERVLGLPVYVPELLWLPLLGLVPRRYWSSLAGLLVRPLAWLITTALLALFLIGLFVTGDFFEVARSARPFAYIAFLMLAVQLCADADRLMAHVFWLSAGAVAGEFINVLAVSGLTGLHASVDLSATFVVVGTLAGGRGWIRKVAAAVIGVAVVFLSGFRITLLAILFAFLMPVGLMTFRYLKSQRLMQALGKSVAALGGLAAFVLVGQPLWNAIASAFPNRWFRVVTRITRFFALGVRGSQDVTRLESWRGYFGSLTVSDLWPKGFVATARGLVGLYNDVPLAQALDTFGLVLGVAVAVVLVVVLPLRALSDEMAGRPSAPAAANLYVMFLPFLLAINGRVFYITFESVLFGLVVGAAIRGWSGQGDSVRIRRAAGT